MNIEKEFLDGKKNALSKLQTAKKQSKVDSGILPMLDIINESDDYYTSSSCFGRIVLLEIPNIGDKKEAKSVGKWHRTIEVDELLTAASDARNGQLWLLSQPPILHVVAKTNEAAEKILKTAIASGFKNSGLKSIGKKIVVEICSTERLDAPVGKDGSLFCNKDHLELLVNISNEIMNKSAIKLEKLEEKIKKGLSSYKTTIK